MAGSGLKWWKIFLTTKHAKHTKAGRPANDANEHEYRRAWLWGF